jgi:hypothetical protein
MADDALFFAIDTARASAERGDFAGAVETQERVVAQVRMNGTDAETLVTLSTQLFNLADYYTGMDRYEDAIRVMEEVIVIDERLGLADLESDRQALESVRRVAAMSSEQRRQWYRETPAGQPSVTRGPDEIRPLLDQLDMFPPEERAELEQIMRGLSGLTPEEQARKALEIQAKRREEKS